MDINLNFTATPEEMKDLRREVCGILQCPLVTYDTMDSPLAAGAGGDWIEAATCSDQRLIEIALGLGVISF